MIHLFLSIIKCAYNLWKPWNFQSFIKQTNRAKLRSSVRPWRAATREHAERPVQLWMVNTFILIIFGRVTLSPMTLVLKRARISLDKINENCTLWVMHDNMFAFLGHNISFGKCLQFEMGIGIVGEGLYLLFHWDTGDNEISV